MVTGVLYRDKAAGRELKLSPPSNDEIKNEWRHNSTPPICIHGVHRENLVISGFCLGVNEIFALLQCYAA
jgi:hypothetical protein